MADINARFQLRKGSAELWASVNPILADGEPGIEADTGRLRMGNGSTAFTALPYYAVYDSSAFIGTTSTLYTGNLNSLTGKTIVALGAGVTNGWPSAGVGDFVQHLTTDANNAVQIGYEGDTTAQAWRRTKVSGTWGGWIKAAQGGTTFGESVLTAADAVAGRATIGVPYATTAEVSAATAGKMIDAALFASERFKLGTAQAASGLTTIDFTGIESWANRIEIPITGLTHTGAGVMMLQIGTSGGLVTAGYSSGSATIDNASTQSINGTTGFIMYGHGSEVKSGNLILTRQVGNTWVATHALSRGIASGAVSFGAGFLTLGGALTQVRLLLNAGGNFTAGSVNIIRG